MLKQDLLLEVVLQCLIFPLLMVGFFSFFLSAVPPLTTSTVSPSLALLANNLSMPPSDLPPGASPRKKPRKQQHVISTEEGDMMETNSTDDEKSTAKSLLVKAEKRKSPPKEYIGNDISDVFVVIHYLLFCLFLREGALSHSHFLNMSNKESKYLFLTTFCIVVVFTRVPG